MAYRAPQVTAKRPYEGVATAQYGAPVAYAAAYEQEPAYKQPRQAAVAYPAYAQPQYAAYAPAFPAPAYAAPEAEIATETIWIPNTKTGRIIGKQGRQIIEFKTKSGADINVGKEEAMVDGNRDVTIRGTRMAIAFASGMIRGKLQQDNEEEQEMTFTIPDSSAGYIIGKGGSALKEIKAISGCNLQISNKDDSSNSERTVTLTGLPSSIAIARGLVDGRLQQSSEEGKYYSRLGGCFMALFQAQPVNLAGGGPPRAAAPSPYAAPPAAYPAAYPSPYGAPAAAMRMPAPGGRAAYQGGPVTPGVGAPLVIPYSAKGEEAAVSTQEVYIPVSMVGRIIGKGGSHIRTLKAQSGAEINIDKEDEQVDGAAEPQRKVTLSGTNVALILADGLMRSKMAEQDQTAGESTMRIPNNRAGQIIGKAGASIRMIKETSGAQIQMSNADEMVAGVDERVITMTGTPSQNLIAEALILAKMAQADSHSR